MSIIQKAGEFAESSGVQKIVTWVIIINAVVLGLETVPFMTERYGVFLSAIDKAALAVFVVELAAKLSYRRLSFFRNGWNCFDFIIVAIALVPATGPLTVLRALRILRLLRLLSVVPSMRVVIEGLLRALPGMGSIASMIFLIFYIGAVLSTKLYGADFPQWFGTLGASMYSLFQIMTLESWSMGIVRPVMEVHATAWAFFVPFIMVTTFAVLNLFVGTIVNAMQSEGQAEQARAAEAAHQERSEMLVELKRLNKQIAHVTQEVSEVRRSVVDHRGVSLIDKTKS
jgi:voltage-gated sodium channel